MMIVAAFFLLLLLVSIALMIHSCVSANPLVGNWKMDSMTSYEFYEDGQGALVVPRGKYPFAYTMEDDLLTIDFYDENAHDSQFTYQLDDNVLTLVGGNKDLKGTYVLEKQ